jgi:hypothetical protein
VRRARVVVLWNGGMLPDWWWQEFDCRRTGNNLNDECDVIKCRSHIHDPRAKYLFRRTFWSTE